MSDVPDVVRCPKCGRGNDTAAAQRLQVDMHAAPTEAVPIFPDALAVVTILQCTGCGYRLCLDYWIELDDNPEFDINAQCEDAA